MYQMNKKAVKIFDIEHEIFFARTQIQTISTTL